MRIDLEVCSGAQHHLVETLPSSCGCSLLTRQLYHLTAIWAACINTNQTFFYNDKIKRGSTYLNLTCNWNFGNSGLVTFDLDLICAIIWFSCTLHQLNLWYQFERKILCTVISFILLKNIYRLLLFRYLTTAENISKYFIQKVLV